MEQRHRTPAHAREIFVVIEWYLTSVLLQIAFAGKKAYLIQDSTTGSNNIACAKRYCSKRMRNIFSAYFPHGSSISLSFMHQRRLDADQFQPLMETLCLLLEIVGWPYRRPRRKRNVSAAPIWRCCRPPLHEYSPAN